MRQIVLDTETTGLSVDQGHRVIEIGCVELINRRYTGNCFHEYFNPEREVEPGALQIHGLSNEFLATKPIFKNLSEKFLEFIKDAELIIHNAPFDVGFLNYELQLIKEGFISITDCCGVIDTLVLARQKHPGQQNSLDALCRRYQVDNSQRDFHGALLDAKLLAEVYLAMTGGQGNLFAEEANTSNLIAQVQTAIANKQLQTPLIVLHATTAELTVHQQYLETIKKASSDKVIWPIAEKISNEV